MSPLGDDQDATAARPAPAPQRKRRSRMDPSALAAAAAADQIPLDRRWPPALTVLLVVTVPAIFWALIWFLFFR